MRDETVIGTERLAFHWMLPKAGEVAKASVREATELRFRSTEAASPGGLTDMEGWPLFARAAEAAGIESLLISFSRYEPDPLIVSLALGLKTTRLKFLAAYRSGLIQPTSFVQQVNTLSNLIDGRIALNIVAGSSPAEQKGYGDYLDHDARYARAEEMLAICNAFWRDEGAVDFEGRHYRLEGGDLHTRFHAPDRAAPQIYVSGHSRVAQELAYAQASCWVRTADTPENLRDAVAEARRNGIEVCLRFGVICRPTLDEAVAAGRALLPDNVGSQRDTVETRTDSQMTRESLTEKDDQEHWPKPWLWTGLVPHNGPVWVVLLGTPAMLVEALMEYKTIGVTQFIISGWPELDEMRNFGQEVIPLIRRIEN